MELLFPQEIEVWYIIPLIRKNLTIELKKLGMRNTEIAEKLGITKAAVSQYLSGKRASYIRIDEPIRSEIQKSAKAIVQGASMVAEVNNLIKLCWESGFICKIHKTICKLPSDCQWCNNK